MINHVEMKRNVFRRIYYMKFIYYRKFKYILYYLNNFKR